MQNRQQRSAFTRLAAVAVLLALATPGPAGAWTWPVAGPVLQSFAFDEENPLVPGQHRGIDIQGTVGAPVLAPAAGTVTFAGRVAANGLTITIQTAEYAVTLLHLGSFLVGAGAVVAEGQPVAIVGTSGVTAHSVPYVQLGVRLSSDPQGYLDPMSFLPPVAAPPPVPSEPPAPLRSGSGSGTVAVAFPRADDSAGGAVAPGRSAGRRIGAAAGGRAPLAGTGRRAGARHAFPRASARCSPRERPPAGLRPSSADACRGGRSCSGGHSARDPAPTRICTNHEAMASRK